jgi:hypothetical protein
MTWQFIPFMRLCVSLLAVVVLMSGCSLWPWHKKSPDTGATTSNAATNAPGSGKKGKDKLIVTQETTPVGKVVRVNETARFAVLNFPVGMMPAAQQLMNVYRRGLKVGEVKVTGLRQDNNIVADILKGEAQIGDEIRVD